MIWGMIAGVAIYFGANLYLFIRLWQALSELPTACRALFAVVFWLLSVALFIAIAARNLPLGQMLHRTLFTVGSWWIVFLLYMVLTTAILDVAHVVFPQMQHGVWYALGITTLILIAGNINYRNPRVENLEIQTDKPLSDELRIVAVSDVHLGYGTSRRALARYVDMINEQQPDVVLIVGDLIDNSIRPVVEAHMEEELQRLSAPKGVYMVAGNHEYISGIDACAEFVQRTPIRLLRDSVVKVDDAVAIIGRDDRMNMRRKSVKELVDSVDKQCFTIVIDHQPYDMPQSEKCGVDLHLSGHTHRGQVWPISWLTDAMYDQSHGYRKWSSTHAYVLQGLSLWGPPFRIGTNSDMLVVDIKQKN